MKGNESTLFCFVLLQVLSRMTSLILDTTYVLQWINVVGCGHQDRAMSLVYFAIVTGKYKAHDRYR